MVTCCQNKRVHPRFHPLRWNPHSTRPFLSQLRNKLQGNATKFPDAQHEMRYAFGFLKGAAYVTEPHFQDYGIAFQTLAEFTQVLRTAFGNPDEIRTARREIDNL